MYISIYLSFYKTVEATLKIKQRDRIYKLESQNKVENSKEIIMFMMILTQEIYMI